MAAVRKSKSNWRGGITPNMYDPDSSHALAYLNIKLWGVCTSISFHNIWDRIECGTIAAFLRTIFWGAGGISCLLLWWRLEAEAPVFQQQVWFLPTEQPIKASREGGIHLDWRRKEFMSFNDIKMTVTHAKSKEIPGCIWYRGLVPRSRAKCSLPRGRGDVSSLLSILGAIGSNFCSV